MPALPIWTSDPKDFVVSTFEPQNDAPGGAIPARAPRRSRLGLAVAVVLSLALHAGVISAMVVGAWSIAVGGSAVGDPGVASSVVELSPAPAAPPQARPATAESSPPPLIIATGEGAGPSSDTPAPRLDSERSRPSSAAITGLSSQATPQTTLRADAAAVPGAIFAGVGTASARSVVYAVDASGPMVGSLPEVFTELRASVERLKPTQRFAVIVFRRAPDGSKTFESFVGSPVRATDQAKRELAVWLESIRPSGRSNPLDGLTAALAMNPDAVFLLSRSIERSGGGVWDLGKDRTLAELERLNPRDASGRRRVAIRTIQFLDEDPTGTMQAIAHEHAGSDAEPTSPGGAYTVIRRAGELAR